MLLLDPKEIKNEKHEAVEQALRRASKINKEESQLVISINNAKQKAKEEVEKIDQELKDYKQNIKEKIKVLTQEIVSLEEKRKMLLEPVDKIRKEAEQYLKNAKDELKKVDREKEKLANISIENKELSNELKSREKLIKQHEEDIDYERKIISKKKSELETSKNYLDIQWYNYKKELTKLNEQLNILIKKEGELKIREKVLEERKVTQDKREAELDGIKKGLLSEREAIKQAKIHLGIK